MAAARAGRGHPIPGPAPWGGAADRAFTPASLAARFDRRRAPVKAALLDQRAAAGMGNIYADEALWQAQIHPLRPIGDLDEDELKRLHKAVREALKAGIARQGTTLRDYRTPDGETDRMQSALRVYGEGGRALLLVATRSADTRCRPRHVVLPELPAARTQPGTGADVRVVVTGGAGFIGSHVADAFVERGDEVLVVDDFSSGSRDYVPDRAILAELDIADSDRVQEAFAASSPSTSATWPPRRA